MVSVMVSHCNDLQEEGQNLFTAVFASAAEGWTGIETDLVKPTIPKLNNVESD